ncbi:hypothetical protein T06_10398 [Trichinella sp. T6]|nr:hypothetical protein T06_10398 [Trichinella sp. T6]
MTKSGDDACTQTTERVNSISFAAKNKSTLHSILSACLTNSVKRTNCLTSGKLTAWQMAHQLLLSYMQCNSHPHTAVAPMGRPVANETPIAPNNRLRTMDQEKTSARHCNSGCKLSTNPTARWDFFPNSTARLATEITDACDILFPFRWYLKLFFIPSQRGFGFITNKLEGIEKSSDSLGCVGNVHTQTPLLPVVTDDDISQRYCWNNLNEKIALQRIVTLSTVCPFLFVNSMQGWTADVDQVKVDGGDCCKREESLNIRSFVDPTLSGNCYCPRTPARQRAGGSHPIFFFVSILKFLSTTTASFDALCDSLGRLGTCCVALKNGELYSLWNKRRMHISVPVRLFDDDDDDDGDGVKPQLLAWSGLSH